jgi:hypothetical protein
MIATDPIPEPPERGRRVSNCRARVVALHMVSPAELELRPDGGDKT